MATVIHDLNLSLLILDRRFASEIVEERKKLGHDRRDEVWDGVYRIASPRDNLHAHLASDLCAIFVHAIDWSDRGEVRGGVNVSDRSDNWLYNFRIPSVCVMLRGGVAENCDDFWYGGPDFVVEISTPDEDPHEKLDFYETIGVRELLIVNRDPWRLEFFRLTAGHLKLAAEATPEAGEIASDVIPFHFRLAKGEERPTLIVTNTETQERRAI